MHSLAVTIMYYVERYSHGLDPDLTPPVGRVQLDEDRSIIGSKCGEFLPWELTATCGLSWCYSGSHVMCCQPSGPVWPLAIGLVVPY